MRKLTDAQMDLLRYLANGSRIVKPGYRPALKLVEREFASAAAAPFDCMRLTITPAGREALATHQGEQNERA